jgi:putative transposase
VAQECIGAGLSKSLVLRVCHISRSSFYYQHRRTGKKTGRSCSTVTYKTNGACVPDSTVIEDIKDLLGEEFVDYGYLKTTVYLRDEMDYVINPKKVYRLMKENNLLYVSRSGTKFGKRQWVKQLVPDPEAEFTYLEFDIKYVYIQGKRRNAQVLTVLDVFSRWSLAHTIRWNIRQQDVVALFDTIFESYSLPLYFYVRNDNGSQFVAQLVQEYFRSRKVIQEFTKPATPQQNAHIESYRAAHRHSIMERAVCRRYEFDSLGQAVETLDRFRKFYNYRRIHSGVEYKSPYRFLLQRGIDMKQKQQNVPTLNLEILSNNYGVGTNCYKENFQNLTSSTLKCTREEIHPIFRKQPKENKKEWLFCISNINN